MADEAPRPEFADITLTDIDAADGPSSESVVSDSALRAILSSLGVAPSFRDCMRECALTLHQCTQADGATIYRLVSDQTELEQIHSVGFPRRLTELSRRMSLQNSLTGLAIKQRELIISEYVAVDERIPRTFRDDLSKSGVRTVVSLPLLMHAEVVGAITLGWRRRIHFNEYDRDLLMNIGYGIAIAVEHDLREFESTRDSLTGLLNRRAFDERLGQLAEACESSNTPFSLLIMDLDDFKACNDTHGHLVGDQVLRMTAHTLTQELLLERAIAFRIGGEEFVLILPNADANAAFLLGQRICDAVGTQLFSGHEKQPFSITMSAGVAQFRGHENETLSELYGRADMALYKAKHRGKNQVVNDEAEAAHD